MISWNDIKTVAKTTNPLIYAADQVKDTTQKIAGSGDFIPGVNNPFNNTTDGYVDTSRMTSAPAFNSGDSAYKGSTYYDSATGKMMEWTGSGYRQAANDANDSPTYSNYSSGSVLGRNTGSSYDPAEMAALTAQKSLYERLLESADKTKTAGVNKINDSYNLASNRANQDRQRQLGDLSYQRQSTDQDKTQALNQVGDNSRVLRNSLMRVLGMGAGGGSAFDLADGAVAREASKNRTGVMETFGDNYRQLDRADEDTKSAFERLMEDLTRQKSTATENLYAEVESQRQGINNYLSEIAANIARLQGGNQMQAISPYRTANLASQATIDALPEQFRNAVSYQAPTAQKVSLGDYIVDRANIGTAGQQQSQQYSPYSQFLQRKEEERAL